MSGSEKDQWVETEPVAGAKEIAPEDLPLRPLRDHLAISVYWLSNTILWGALLHLAVQARLTDWFSEGSVGYYLGILGFSGGIVGASAQIIGGALSDRSTNRWGRRRPYVLIGSIFAAGALLLLGASRSFALFAGALVLVQLFTNSALGPFSALLPDNFNPREHGKASGFMGIARLLGDTGGLVLAGLLLSEGVLGPHASQVRVTAFHDHRMFLLSAMMAGFLFVTAVFTCLTIKERPLRARPSKSVSDIVFGSFKVDVRGNPNFFWLSISRAVTNVGFYMFLEVMLYFVKYTMRLPDPQSKTMVIMIPAIGAAALASVPSGILSDRYGRRPMVFAAQILMTISAVVFTVTPSMGIALIAAVPAGMAYGVFTAVEWAFACNLLPHGEAARYLGIWNASVVVPQILAFPVAGAIGSAISAQWPGLGWRVDFGIAAGCCLLGTYFLRHVKERRMT